MDPLPDHHRPGYNPAIHIALDCPEQERDHHERVFGHRHRHFRHEDAGHRRKRQGLGLGHRNLSLPLPQAAVERARPRRLVAGDGPLGSQDDGQGQNQADRRKVDRAVGPNARLRVSRPKRQGHSPGDTLERPADRRRVRRDRAPRRRPGKIDQDGRQPGPNRIHRPENPLAAKPRAETFRGHAQSAVAEG